MRITGESRAAQWPDPPSEDAFHGVAGRLVHLIEPQTEADPIGLLIQILVFFGNVIGHSAHFKVEATAHTLNIFAVLVGPTSKGRKGTALDHVRRLFHGVDAGWNDTQLQSGLSSGEGLIWAVRDPMPADGDPGVADKRLLVIESEFAAPLRMMSRDGNVLSATIRQAWDSGDLRILTKNSPAVATDAHISIIGHVSAEELRKELDSSNTANGFGNRFLWTCVRRSKKLPDGGHLDDGELEPTVTELHNAVNHGRQAEELRRDAEATELWRCEYGELSEGQLGLYGSLTARAEAQVMRLACLYALLDHSMVIGVSHLRAALALWRYVDGSVRFLFGDALGHPLADRLLKALRSQSEGLTKTQIRDLLGRHARGREVDEGLDLLVQRGLARCQSTLTGGRPEQRWLAIE
jgi:hypothetical protein